MSSPTVSILCLTYNHEAFVAQTLEGFLMQRVGFDFDVVVSDDCSTDRTVEIVESYRARFGDRLQLLRSSSNLGVTRNFRRAMAQCRGRYIALCEGDDHWRGADKLQKQVDHLESHPGCVLTFHDAEIFDLDGRSHGRQLAPVLRRNASASELRLTRPIPTLTACFRNVLHGLPPELDQAPALDLCLWSLLGAHGDAAYLPGITPAVYRVHQGGVFSMHGVRNRHLMTSQSLLCLSRVYEREGQAALSDALLAKAAAMAGSRLSPWRAAGLAVRVCAWALAAAVNRIGRRMFRQ